MAGTTLSRTIFQEGFKGVLKFVWLHSSSAPFPLLTRGFVKSFVFAVSRSCRNGCKRLLNLLDASDASSGGIFHICLHYILVFPLQPKCVIYFLRAQITATETNMKIFKGQVLRNVIITVSYLNLMKLLLFVTFRSLSGTSTNRLRWCSTSALKELVRKRKQTSGKVIIKLRQLW